MSKEGYLRIEDHVSRYAHPKKVIRDENEEPVSLTPQAFEMRVKLNEESLSVNWLEFFGGDHSSNIRETIQSFRKQWGGPLSDLSAFGIGNVGRLEDVCTEHQYSKVKVLYNEKKNTKQNPSHATIIRLPINELVVMEALASEVFKEIVANKDIP